MNREIFTLNPQHRVIYKDQYSYSAHPFIYKLMNGEWVIVFNRTVRREHVLHPPQDPDFSNVLIRSKDQGQTWDAPRILPGYRWRGTECSAVLETPDGTLLLFQWHYIWHTLEAAQKLTKHPNLWIPTRVVDVDAKTPQGDALQFTEIYPWARDNGSLYLHRSFDQGHTWPESVEINIDPWPGAYSRAGGIQLTNGDILWPLTEIPTWSTEVVIRSGDGGRTWSSPVVAARLPEQRFSESSLLELASGRILMLLREHPSGYLHQTYSDDGGDSWQPPFRLPVWGYPPHLLQLADGRILCTYGHRREPYSIQAIISDDGGETWGEPFMVRDQLPNRDLGYPASLLLDDGSILTVYYAPDYDGITCIQATHYKI